MEINRSYEVLKESGFSGRALRGARFLLTISEARAFRRQWLKDHPKIEPKPFLFTRRGRRKGEANGGVRPLVDNRKD
jgi:hypothetical protein